jgi:Ser/Thr protein kinase RdoA (MazF antagonist)
VSSARLGGRVPSVPGSDGGPTVDSQPAWSEEVAAELGHRALESVGLGGASLTLLKFGLLANYRVDNPARFLKVADPGFRSAFPIMERSLRLSAWLDANGLPVAGAAKEGSAEPVAVGDAWAGLWQWVDALDERPRPRLAGELLRRLHDLLSDCPVPCPEMNHLQVAQNHIEALREKGHIDDASIDFLMAHAKSMEQKWNRYGSELGVGKIHGDIAVDNLLRTSRGPVLIDLDNAQIGPREWDLVKVIPGSPGGWEEDEWPEFTSGYGHDPRATPASDVLRDVRHLRTLVWKLGDPRYTEHIEQAQRLLNEWLAAPDKRCYELDWLETGGG